MLAVVRLWVQPELVINKLEQLVEVHIQFKQQLYPHIDDPVFFAGNRAFSIKLMMLKVELA